MPTRVKPAGWVSGEEVTRTQINQLQTNLTYCADVTQPINIVNNVKIMSGSKWTLDSTSKFIINDITEFTNAENLTFDGEIIGKTRPIHNGEFVQILTSGEHYFSSIGEDTIVLTGTLQGDCDIILTLSAQACPKIICNFNDNGYKCEIFPDYYDTYRLRIYPGQVISFIQNTTAATGTDYYTQPLAKFNTKNDRGWSLISESNISGGTFQCSKPPPATSLSYATTGKSNIDLALADNLIQLGSKVVGYNDTYYSNGVIFTNNKKGDRYEFTLKGDLSSPVSYTTLQCYPFWEYLQNIDIIENIPIEFNLQKAYVVKSLGNTLAGGWDKGGDLYQFPLVQETARGIKPPQEINGWFTSNYDFPILRFGLMVDWIIASTSTQFPVQIFGPVQFSIKQYRILKQ